jgi:hypothetical protein
MLVVLLAAIAVTGQSNGKLKQDDLAWKQAQIEDALRAAPAPVTTGARIFAWQDTQLVLVRDGAGSYTCVASGSWSLRLGKTALPYPDPFCADQNAWAYLQRVWSEPDPLHPSQPFPRAPGLVWMLAGMNVVNGRVSYSKDDRVTIRAGAAGSGTITMTPHVMILPLPVDAATAELPIAYDPDHALAMWVMGGGTPTAHLHVHLSPATYRALKKLK